MGVAHECLSMKDGHLNEVSEYLQNYLSMNVHQGQICKIKFISTKYKCYTVITQNHT